MSTIGKIVILLIVLFFVILGYACCLVAATSDREAEKIYREYKAWKKKREDEKWKQ